MDHQISLKIFFFALIVFINYDFPISAQQFPDPSSILTVGSGGRSIKESALKEGDIIVSTTKENISEIIRNITSSPVSHAMVYVGNGMVVEAIGSGVRLRTLEQATSDSTIAVAFRYPKITKDQQTRIVEFLYSQLGKKYNFIGLVRHPNFKVVDELCSAYASNRLALCKNWVGKVVSGIDILVRNRIISSKDEFFCSELVATAFENAGLNIFSKPSETNPGEIPVIATFKTLEYVGHLKTPQSTNSVLLNSPYLFVWAGDQDGQESDFLAVLDTRPSSEISIQTVINLTDQIYRIDQ